MREAEFVSSICTVTGCCHCVSVSASVAKAVFTVVFLNKWVVLNRPVIRVVSRERFS